MTFTNSDQTRQEVMDNCLPDTEISPYAKSTIDLKLPNIAIDQDGNQGTWTMIIDGGFEIRIGGKRMVNYFQYTKSFWGKITSYCNVTWVWHYYVESESLPPKEWGCWKGVKVNDTIFKNVKKTHEYIKKEKKNDDLYGTGLMMEDFRVIDQQKHWEFFQQFKDEKKLQELVNDLPEAFDWSHMNGSHYDPHIRNQEQCGSCYIFSIMGMLDSRIMIETKKQTNPIYSEQNVVNCGKPTNEGCKGGFPYLVSSFSRGYGVVEDSCVKYHGGEGKCSDEKCTKYYVDDYEYVGGYYGASNEQNMMLEIYNNGPIAVSFWVDQDFFKYDRGVFHCGGVKPFQANHAVTIVGWGKGYWIVRNSWGSGWGNRGYFWMRKGVNSCNIEAAASSALLKLQS